MPDKTQHSFFSKLNETTPVFLLMFALLIAELSNWNPTRADNAYLYLKPVIQTIISVLIIGLALKKTSTTASSDNLNKKWYWLIFAGGLLSSFIYTFFIFKAIPVANSSSDIVISIETYVQRFLAGETVYTPIIHNTHTVIPNYLSMMWMPFIPAEVFNFDYRFIAFFIAILGFFLYTKRAIQKECNTLLKILLVLSPWIVFFFVSITQDSILPDSIEWMIVGFYFILAYSIFSKNAILKGIGVGLVALSRFSFFTWGPFYVFTTYKSLGLRKTLVALGTLMALILGLFVFPFFMKDTSILDKGNAYYDKVMAHEWKKHKWQEEEDVPFHLSRGDNFAIFFYSFQEGTPKEKIKTLKTVLLYSSLLGGLFIFFLYFKYKDQFSFAFLNLIGLKIILLIFYAFIIVPFEYLFLPPICLSMFLMMEKWGDLDSANKLNNREESI